MPFVVGILRSELTEVLSLPMDEVLIIDIDKNGFIRTPAESDVQDLNLLPQNFISHLRRTVRNVTKSVKSIYISHYLNISIQIKPIVDHYKISQKKIFV